MTNLFGVSVLMRMRVRANDKLIIAFLVLLAILPSYFRILNIQVKFAITCIFFMILLVSYRKEMAKLRYTRINSFLFPMLIWAAAIVTLCLIHGGWYHAVYNAVLWLGIAPFLFRKIDSKDRFLGIIDALISVSFILALLGIAEEVLHWNAFFLLNGGEEVISSTSRMRLGILRVMSFTAHPITYCVFIIFILSLIAYRLSIPDTKQRRFLIITYVLLFVNAILTVSRSAILALLLSQVLLLLFSGFKRFIINGLKIILAVVIIGGIIYALSEGFRNIVNMSFLMFMAIFSDDYVSVLSSLNFGGTNYSGIGQRTDLYEWVWEEVKNHKLIGFGPTSTIARMFTTEQGYSRLKDTIEVQYLRTLYRYGLIGMISEICLYVSIVFTSAKKRIKATASWEGKLSFSSTVMAVMISYLVVCFAVMQNEEVYILFCFVELFSAYLFYNKYNNERENDIQRK